VRFFALAASRGHEEAGRRLVTLATLGSPEAAEAVQRLGINGAAPAA
jgi:hypothetical protein